MKNIYEWDKGEIISEYIKSIINVIKTNGKNFNYRDDKNYSSDMLRTIMHFPEFYPDILKILNFKRDLNKDRYFFEDYLTDFQISEINKIINNVLEENFSIYGYFKHFEMEIEDCILYSKDFLCTISPLLYNELNIVLNNKRLYVDKNDKNLAFCGSCFSISNKNYYQIINDKSSSLFTSLNHENVHGLANKLSERRFDNDSSAILYREVGSILIELYANEYLFKNHLISEEEYIYTYNLVYSSNLYSDIELTDFLYRLSKIDINKSAKNIKKLIDIEAKEKPNYDFIVYELNEFPLKHYLTYLYSGSISIALFNMFKDSPKHGIDAALDIMLNVNEENEKELFRKYNINICNALDIYKKENNRLVKKKRD